MKLISPTGLTLSLVFMALALSSCGKAKDTINAANDLVDSPAGFWTTNDSKLGKIGWKITKNDYKKCTIALDNKVTEDEGSVTIEDNKVKYTSKGSTTEYTADYNKDNNTLTENHVFGLEYKRADDAQIKDFNDKDCHL